MRKPHIITIIVFILFAMLANAKAQTATLSDYLILHSIAGYDNDGKGRCGKGAGLLAATGHFREDHNDITCRTDYYNTAQKLAVSIQVSKHAGGDSDKWLLHEVERAFQKPEALGSAYAGKNPIRDINGNRIFYMWRLYRWISNYVIVSIEAFDPQGLKPEPTEVAQAYLQKFPSTMSSTLVLDDAHKATWIKDEMDRRLWLCDKWFTQLQLGTVKQNDTFQAAASSMNVFLDYREKYYGIVAQDDKNILAGYLAQNNGEGIQSKLAEYKTWWGTHKDRTIRL